MILPPAKQDIKEAVLWYEEQQVGLGKKFINHIKKKVATICLNPKLSAIRYGQIRTFVLDIFPFMIHYEVDDASKLVVIISVLHTFRDPKTWRR